MLPHLARMQAVDKVYPALKVPNDFVVTVIETDYDANSFSAILLKAAKEKGKIFIGFNKIRHNYDTVQFSLSTTHKNGSPRL